MPSLIRTHLFRIFSILLVLTLAGTLGGSPAFAQTSIDVVLHYVEGVPSEEKIVYDVTAYVSVYDSTGNPIKDLKPGDFMLAEDSQGVEVLSAELAPDAPINLVLLLDTSGSMSGPGITAAKNAASNFIGGLNPEDRVAVVTFDDTVNTIIDFTTDHRAARDELSLVDAKRGAGTCLYDAAYQAVQMTATVPSGRRAVVLFTDGVDETPAGKACSVHDADNVVDIANDPGTRSPLYTLGMGSKVDQKNLQRLAQDTGGRFFFTPDDKQLDAIFIRLSDTLRSQYAVKYSSTAGPGSHTLAITAKYLSAQDTDTRGFLLPNFPLRLNFTEPAVGAEVSGMTSVKIETFGGGETIQSVIIQINEATVTTLGSIPYNAEVDLSAYPAGDLTITAIAQGAGGIELARTSRTVVVSAAGTKTPPDEDGGGISDIITYIIVGGSLIGAVIIILIAMAIIRKRRDQQRNKEWEEKVGGVGSPTMEEIPSGSDRTMDSWEMSPDALAMLTVTSSDDSTMIGQRFEITNRRTTLGRKADNDIIFPKDSPVSRHHALIEEKNGGLFLNEIADIDDAGKTKRPTYGTFVNDNEVGAQAILLQSGDEIRLGKRVKLKFEASNRLRSGEEKTFDGFTGTSDTMETREI